MFAICLIFGSALLIPTFSYAQDSQDPSLDTLSQAALDKIDKTLKDKTTDDKTKEKLNKIAKALRKGTLIKGSSSGVSKGDFNGDGFADLAIGIPHEETPAGTVDAGAVIVIYGTVAGLNGFEVLRNPPQFWSQNSPGVPGSSEAHDEFGAALASGDFNGDGFSDLAIGIPGKTVPVGITGGGTSVFANAGRVVVIYGSPNGLSATDPTVHQPQSFDFSAFGLTNIKGGERLGSALAWGDFNRDGTGDLAMGAPGVDRSVVDENNNLITIKRSGEVWVVYGLRTFNFPVFRPGGLNRAAAPGEQFLVGALQSDTGFGTVLAAGDFNGDGATDLAVGLPNFDFDIIVNGNVASSTKNVGKVEVVVADGARGFLDIFGDEVGFSITELTATIPSANAGDNYGAALAVGDFNGDGVADLAIGIPGRAVGASPKAGAVHVRLGRTTPNIFFNPLLLDGSQIWTQNALFPVNHPFDRSEPNEFFGAALAAGDFNGDGRADLAIGVPLEDVLVASATQNIVMAGEVDVVYGSTGAGLSIAIQNAQVWTKGRGNGALQTLQGAPRAGDLFGFSLSAWNFGDPSVFVGTGDRNQADLAIGAPFEDLFQITGPSAGTVVSNAGAVNVIYGSPGPAVSSTNQNGLTSRGNQLWTAVSPNVPSILEQDANFGFTLY
jgi:hypothetical protein